MAETSLQPVDIAHLNRYTGGDRALNAQILRLFDDQCSEILDRLEGQILGSGVDAGKIWRESAHALKGAARGIGAFSLADIAAELEKTDTSDRAAAIAALTSLKGRAADVHDFIAGVIDAWTEE